jgi:hypothetical protein|tara:strand:- start:662 stop:1273 length:612 start_codon:yes stop_codon:yes gene_type:complete
MDMTTLQQNLVNAKKVMNKVDGGSFTSGNVNLSQTNMTDSTGLLSSPTPLPQSVPTPNITESRQDLSPKSNITEDRINKSRLPDAIKQAMINNPIPDIPFNGGGVGLTDEFLSGVQEQMNKQGMGTSEPQTNNTKPQINNVVPPIGKTTKKISSKNLKSIIKESVKELLDETIGLKTDNDENFQFRVGDRIFYGKITSSKTVK